VPKTRIVSFDHISLPVRKLAQARRFYEAALGAIGMRVNMEMDDAFALGSKKQMIFWLVKDKKASGGAHIAFRVDHRAEVDAFHRAAIAAGGTDNGPPGPRKNYGPNYYAAFVKDVERNNIEVVCYARAASSRAAAPRKKRRK
jgi:catechol 2,3-dioxygenase-like lactoylglutathione lyase family enzyme